MPTIILDKFFTYDLALHSSFYTHHSKFSCSNYDNPTTIKTFFNQHSSFLPIPFSLYL